MINELSNVCFDGSSLLLFSLPKSDYEKLDKVAASAGGPNENH